ncbi:hypothetical protein C5748_07355 [Phyllobacterium phragmitis]|uniref:MerR family transcriptional regulator n=1 Tax=Phyllobacterium phragmitis TaxID=2670329 RepID=A0A2S9IV35_9HYPH|nr:hypothetical protein [Phyllobacterium phragmitis]PRD44387.1 hypothetical protein C5748_07355 [Phyllobacterium phragmitis]
MSRAELAGLLGLSVGTVRNLPGWSSASLAPTDATLATMRRELVKRTRERLEEARIQREIDRQILEAECREHLAYCNIIDPDDERDEAA